jgi:hypothetical protein
MAQGGGAAAGPFAVGFDGQAFWAGSLEDRTGSRWL